MNLIRDAELKVVWEKYPDQFENAVNTLLSSGTWRIVATEVSVTDSQYVAIAIRSEWGNL